MLLYRINVRHADGAVIEDDEGVEVETEKEAVEQARIAASQMIGDRLRFGRSVPYRAFEVTDETGALISTITLDDVVKWASEKGD